MTKEELRTEYTRLSFPETIKDINDLMDIYLEYLFLVMMNHENDKVKTLAERDAKMINQMMFTKTAHLKEVIKGVEYTSKEDMKLNKIIDPTIVAVLTRNIFETVAMFNIVNVQPQNDDEKLILYNLWAIAGLKYRQSFVDDTSIEENKQKAKDEYNQIMEYTRQIEQTNLYQNLSVKNQHKIKTQIKDKDYKIKFSEDKIDFLGWPTAMQLTGVKEKIMGKLYTYFSLYAHPSNVSVFQFAGLFQSGKEDYITMTLFNSRYIFILLSIFIADYIKVFPNSLMVFNKLPIVHQIVINSINTMARNESYSINDSVKNLI
ncbi:hypothetical protein [uncultured Mucilaginibacter sp.]|uniref:hypothetical protein n=1 Tax=uncultured Mucilaginibacter sp. TaxID=797541 RepID=UPI0025DF848B|nr:hypothetical protein [uncultured Mucilaginibacter sp.]